MDKENTEEVLKILKTFIDNNKLPELVDLKQKSEQNLRFLPKYIDPECIDDSVIKRKKIKEIAKIDDVNTKLIKRSLFLEFNCEYNNDSLYLILVAKIDDDEGNKFFELAEKINTLNKNQIFNFDLYKNCNQKNTSGNKTYDYIHTMEIVSYKAIEKIISSPQKLELELKVLFDMYIPNFLNKLDILLPVRTA